jgi:phosphodiesterase/alkaline phosphatase D-like protein
MATTPGTASGSAATAVSASLSSLTPNTTYNYRIKAVNSVGTTYSANSTFTTAVATSLPTITNVASSAITTNTATVSADVNANNATTTISVEYGLTTAYGSTLATTPSTASGNTATAVSASLSSLTPNTIYNYRIKAVNSVGTTYSANATFQTNNLTSIVLLEDNGMVYPNPSANGKFILKTEGIVDREKIKVYNAMGTVSPFINLEQNKLEIDLSMEASGIYYVSFELQGQQMIAKLIKK